jgi:predicted transcriptional regulator YdeE
VDVALVALDEIKLVGIKVVGRLSELSHRVPLAWLDLVRRLDEIPGRTAAQLFYGAFLEADHQSGAADGEYRYWVGVAVTAFDDLPVGMTTLAIPARSYAMAAVQGGAEQIDATYIGMVCALEEQGRRTDPGAYGFERFDDRRMLVTPPYERFDYDVFRPLA